MCSRLCSPRDRESPTPRLRVTDTDTPRDFSARYFLLVVNKVLFFFRAEATAPL